MRQAVILAAGRGSRLGTEGDSQPKCLLPLAGRPLLHWTLDALQACGVQRNLIITGWQAERLRPDACETRHNPRWAASGAVRSLQCADDWLAQVPTLVLYGDGAYAARTLGRILAAPAADVLVPGDRCWRALWQRRFTDPLVDAETWQCRDGRLLDIGGRASSIDAIEAQFMGLLRLTPRGWRRICAQLARWEGQDGAPSIDRMDMTTLLRRLLDAGIEVRCIDIDGGWVEIDSQSDRDAVERALREPGFVHDFR